MRTRSSPALHTLFMASFLLGLTLAGCTVGPSYEEPDVASSESWNSRLKGGLSDAELDPKSLAQWWTTLNEPILSSLIERATAANLDLRTARAQLRQARAQRMNFFF